MSKLRLRIIACSLLTLQLCNYVVAQPLNNDLNTWQPLRPLALKSPQFKIKTRKFGALLGVQRGKYTMFELGAEKQWKKVKLTHPPTIAVNGLLHYNIKNNVLGYKAGVWSKTGRIALSWGVELAYVTDFDQHRFGGGPQIGFKLLGFHLVNGYNFMTKAEGFDTFNPIYISLRYFFINKRKFSVEKSKKGGGDKKKDDKPKKK